MDAPHHMRAHEVTEYREGVVLEKTGDANDGSIVDCGLTKVSYTIVDIIIIDTIYFLCLWIQIIDINNS